MREEHAQAEAKTSQGPLDRNVPSRAEERERSVSMSLDSQLSQDEFYAKAYKAPVEEELKVERQQIYDTTIGEVVTPFVMGSVSLSSAAGIGSYLLETEINGFEQGLFAAIGVAASALGGSLLHTAFVNYQAYRSERRVECH